MNDPTPFPRRDFAQLFRLTINSWVSPSPPCRTSASTQRWVKPPRHTREAELEGGLQEELNRNTVSSPGLSTNKTGKFPNETKSYFPKEQQCKTQQPRLLPAGMQPWGLWKSRPSWAAFGEPKHGDNSKRQPLCNMSPNTWNIFS